MLKHITNTKEFTPEFVESILYNATWYKTDDPSLRVSNYNKKSLRGQLMATLFYEPSTRTRFSFEAAAKRLGMDVITTEAAGLFSSAVKGETLEDTIRIVSGYADCIVLRHPENDSAEKAVSVSSVPIINAGAGSNQHPTQTLTDLFTIYEHYGKLTDLHIALVGDLKYSRTIHSLAYYLGKLGATFYLVSPHNLELPEGLKYYLLHEKNCNIFKLDKITDLIDYNSTIDVIYQTRIQMERIPFKNRWILKIPNKNFTIDAQFVKNMKCESLRSKEEPIILHPLPRTTEILPEVDNLPQAKYFEQAKNGMYVRMALLDYLLS